MFLSIIIPVYNVELYIKECIESIINQVLELKEDIEILLIDDGSTDNSGKICDEYQVRYSNFIRVFHNKNQGLLLTRRFGYVQSKGEYIINCDSDDSLEQGMISKLLNVIKKTNADVVIYNAYTYDGKNKEVFCKDIFSKSECTPIDKELVYKEFLTSYKIVSMCTKVFRKSCLDLTTDYEFYKGVQNGEDTLQSAVIYSKANSIIYLNNELYNYRIGRGMTAKFDPNYYYSFKIICENLQKYEKEWGIKDFNKFLSIKLFSSVGRAITQSGLNKKMNFRERRKYLDEIRNDILFEKNMIYFNEVRHMLQRNYRILIKLLIKRQYKVIHGVLKLKNFIG